MIHACTIDVEDYYQVSAFDGLVPREHWPNMPSRVEDSVETILDILADAKVRGDFFVLGRVAERFPKLLQRIHAAGHHLACHSDDHRLVYQMTPAEFREDLRTCKRRIEDAVGIQVRAFRAPSFSITRASSWAPTVLVEEGFELDSSIFPIKHDRYGWPNACPAPFRLHTSAGSLVEFPPTTTAFLGARWPGVGGGYFRLYPYWLTHRFLRRVEAEGRPANLYLHPWEFDPKQPKVKGLNFTTRFRHYVNQRLTAPRLKRLLKQFRFGSLADAISDRTDLPNFRIVNGEFTPCEPVL